MQNMTSTGSIASTASLFRVRSSDRVKSALSLSRFDGRIAVVNQGKVKTVHTPAPPKVDRNLGTQRSRFVTQSLKRTLPDCLRVQSDKGAGQSCPIRVIRKSIFVGRPEYLGAGQWSN